MSDFDSQLARIQALAQGRQAVADKAAAVVAVDVAARREQLRLEMPHVAQVVDDFRAVFGEGVRVLYAEENGKRVESKLFRERGW